MSSFQDAILKEFDKAEQYRTENFGNGQSLISDFIVDEDDDNVLHCFLLGVYDSPHHNAIYRLQINLPADFPKSMPAIKFVDPIPYNPNISTKGTICLNVYSNWKNNNFSIINMLDRINFLLYNPNPDDPYNSDAAKLYLKENQEEYAKQCRTIAEKSNQMNKGYLCMDSIKQQK